MGDNLYYGRSWDVHITNIIKSEYVWVVRLNNTILGIYTSEEKAGEAVIKHIEDNASIKGITTSKIKTDEIL